MFDDYRYSSTRGKFIKIFQVVVAILMLIFMLCIIFSGSQNNYYYSDNKRVVRVINYYQRVVSIDSCHYIETTSGYGSRQTTTLVHVGDCPNPVHKKVN